MNNKYPQMIPNPRFAQQQKILMDMSSTLTAVQNASNVISNLSPTYLRSINQATEMFNHVDIITLARSAKFARELMPIALATQKFLTKMDEIEPLIAEKTFKALSTQTLNNEIILPPESPKEISDLISTLKELVTSKKANDISNVVLAVNSVQGKFLYDSVTWNVLLWLSVIIVILKCFLCLSDEETKYETSENEIK